MNRRSFLASMSALGTMAARAASGKTNVLFIVADDMNNALGCYGNKIVKTPNLDRLAERGVRFDRAYCQFPVCAPSRASFLSGRYPESTKVWDLVTPTRKHMQEIVMLPEFFRNNGYFSAHIGKIYHTGDEHVDPRSWDYAVEETGKSPPESEILEKHELGRPRNHTMEWAQLKTPDEKTPDGIVARQSADLLRKRSKEDKPFFLAVGFRRPHGPYAAPQKYFDMYTASNIPLPEVPEGYKPLPAAKYEVEDRPKLTDQQTREYIKAYYACNSFIDAQVGVLIDAMDQLDLWKNTIVVFFGDHGYHLGDHNMWHKMTLFEESVRVPLMVYAPGHKGMGKACNGLVELVDLYPTLAEACGLKPPATVEGRSFVAQLDDPSRPGKKAAYAMVGRNDDRTMMTKEVEFLGKTVRTDRWRYTEWDQGRRGTELYDHKNDPNEYKNLASDPQYKDVVRELQALLKKGPISSGKT